MASLPVAIEQLPSIRGDVVHELVGSRTSSLANRFLRPPLLCLGREQRQLRDQRAPGCVHDRPEDSSRVQAWCVTNARLAQTAAQDPSGPACEQGSVHVHDSAGRHVPTLR